MKKYIHKAFQLNKKVLQKAIHISEIADKKLSKPRNPASPHNLSHTVGLQAFCNSFAYEVRPLNLVDTKRKQAYVNFLVPTFDEAGVFGGIATATRIAALVAEKKNLPLRVICIDRPGSIAYLNNFLTSIGASEISKNQLVDLSSRHKDSSQTIDFYKEDLNIATAWWTAHILNELDLRKKYIYIIQDYEPIFYNLGDLYAYAEATYETSNFVPICNTKLLYDYLVVKGHENIKRNKIFFEPAVDRELFKPNNISKDKKRLFIYGRPTTQRNLMVHALRLLEDATVVGVLVSEEWDVYIAGDDSAPNIEIMPGVVAKNMGKMSISDYASLAGTIDIAISLMLAPHPSYPPLELACSGAAVVTNSYGIKKDLSFYSKNLFVADLNQKSLLETLKKARDLSKESRYLNAERSTLAKNWSEALDGPVAKLLKQVE